MNMRKTIVFLLVLVAMTLLFPACNLKRNGTYYFMYSSGSCHDHTYRVQYATSKVGPMGPYEYKGCILETNADGMYQFEYLLPGNYTVFSYSTLPSGEKVAVSASVDLTRGAVAQVPTLYIHDGKAYGTSIVKGRVHAAYYHNGSYRGEGWACEHRVYIRRMGEDIPFDDTRVGPDGYFAFQKLQPGEYEVFTASDDIATEIPDFVFQSVTIDEAGQICELPEQFEVIINV